MDAKTYFDAEKKLWTGPDVLPIFNPEASIGEVLLKSFAIFGPKVAQINHDTGNRVTYDEMKVKTIRAAQNLQKLGYKPGQVISFVSKNVESLFPVMFASFCIGCPINVLAPTYGKTEMCHVLKKIKPALLFSSLDAYDLVTECMSKLNINADVYTFGGTNGKSKQAEDLFVETGEEMNFIPIRVDGRNDCAAIFTSSGTTELPKGICFPHAFILNAADSDFCMDDVFFSFNTMNWTGSFRVMFDAMLHGGTHIITTETYSNDLLLHLIETYKITCLSSVPQSAISMLKSDLIETADLSSVKYFYIVGSAIPTFLVKNMRKYLPNGAILPAYGMTEATRIAMSTPGNYKDGSVGQVRKRVTVKIIDENGRQCGINETGEIFVKPYFKFLGYFENEDATKELVDADDFIRTSDIGYFDEDGFLYVVDRQKDLLRYGNEEISPSEIENFLNTISGIKSVCVIGISNEFDSELPAAVIVPDKDSTLNEQYIFDLVYDHFGDSMRLRGGVYFVDDLPTTSNGKIMRRLVKQKATEMYKNRK